MYQSLADGVSAFCIPSNAPRVLRPYSVTTYRVLVKSPLGRIAKCEVKQRTVPEREWLIELGLALDRVALVPEFAFKQDKLRFEYNFNVTWVDDEIFDDSLWGMQEWLQSSVLDAATSLTEGKYSADLRPQLEAKLNGYLSICLERLKEELDPKGLEVALTNGAFRHSLYNYFCSNDQQIKQARLQAIQSFPFLGDRILNNSYADVRRAIDARRPLAPVLANRFKVSSALVRRLSQLCITDVNDRIGKHLINPENLFPLFSNVPTEKVPNNPEQWANFNTLVRRIYDLTKQPIITPLNRSILHQCLANKHSQQIFLGENWREQQVALEAFLAAWVQIARYILLGRHESSQADIKATGLQTPLIEKIGMRKLASLAAQWDEAHRQAEMACEAASDSFRHETWATIITESIKIGDIWVVPLATRESLVAEGKRMENCVATYAYNCRRGQAQIWSLRDDQGKSIANLRTYIAQLENNAHIVSIGELAGPVNSQASSEAVQTSQTLVKTLNERMDDLKKYMLWQTKVATVSMKEITEAHYVRPVLLAMEKVMSGKYDVRALFAEFLGTGEDIPRLSLFGAD